MRQDCRELEASNALHAVTKVKSQGNLKDMLMTSTIPVTICFSRGSSANMKYGEIQDFGASWSGVDIV
jgi:hypothetical protein